MTPLTIPAHDRQGVHVFTAALTPVEMQGDTAALAAGLLGLADLDPAFVELFDSADLSSLGLSGYLAEGLGVPEAQIAPHKARLDGLTGPVLILRSSALQGRGATLTPDPRLTLIASFTEDRPPVHFEPLPSAAASGTLAPDLPAGPPPRLPRVFLLLGAALILTGAVGLYLGAR